MVQSKPELKEERDLFQEIVQGVKKMAGQREESPYVPRHIRQHIEQTVWVGDAAKFMREYIREMIEE